MIGRELGPTGNLTPNEATFRLAYDGVLNHIRITGGDYASDSVLFNREGIVDRWEMTADSFYDLTGGKEVADYLPHLALRLCGECGDLHNHSAVGLLFMLGRKKDQRARKLAEGKLLGAAKHPYPDLEGNTPEEKVRATVYCYAGLNSKVPGRRLIKIGTTTEVLSVYLKRLEGQYDPWLIGRTPGGVPQERLIQKKHSDFRNRDAGREWFEPNSVLLDWVLDHFEHAPGAERTIRKVIGDVKKCREPVKL